MKNGSRITLLIIGLLVVVGGAAFVTVRLEPWLSADAAFKRAEAFAAKGKYFKAFHYVKIASDKKNGDAKYAWAATQLSAMARNPNAAYFYAQRAWKNGRKERDVLQMLVQFSYFPDKKQRLDYAFSLVDQMGNNTDKDDLRAVFYEAFGEIEKALQIRETQFNRAPVPAMATKLGQIYLKSGRDSAAFSLLQSCRAQQRLDDQGYGLLARLYAKRGNLKEAELCYTEAGEVNKSSDKLEYDHAAFLTATKNFDRATSLLDSLVAKYPENKNIETARISVFMAKRDFNGALREIEKSKTPIAVLAPLKARALIRLNRIDEAEAAYDSATAHSQDMRIHLEYGNFLLQQSNKAEKAAAIFQSVLKKYPNEQVASLGLAIIALRVKDFAGAKKYVEPILALKNPTPLAYYLLGQINLGERKPQAAIENCDKALAKIPGFEKALFLKGLAYDLLGKFDKADEIFTSLMLKQSETPEQCAITKQALVAIKTKEKKFAEALKLVDELDPLKKAIKSNRTRIEIYALSGNHAKADETLLSCKNSLSQSEFLFYQSWLMELRGNIPGAAEILEPGLSSPKNALRWAMLRIQAGKTDGILHRLPQDSMKVTDWMRLASMAEKYKKFPLSALFYKNALKLDEKNAIALNNFAYSSLQTQGFNREEVLDAAKKAYLSLSDKPEALQTYAEALIKCEKPAECIKLLLDKTIQTKQSANLLYQIGTAYEKTGDFRGAFSSYRMALAFPESTPDWPSDVSRADLASKVEKLKEKVGNK